MVNARLFELRDSATFIPIIAIRMDFEGDTDSENYLMRRCGYPIDSPQVVLCRADGSGKAYSDPYDWNDRTFSVAHNYILDHWDMLIPGQVIDVEFILGETKTAKQSERITNEYL